MTLAKASALGACLAGAVALGIWIGPHVRNQETTGTISTAEAHDTATPAPVATPAEPAAEVSVARPAQPRVVTKRDRTSKPTSSGVIGFSPEVQNRLKPLLNQGADMSLASDGFRSAEQFATLAHASRNTDVPFMLLKHRVLNEGMTVPDAIRASKPDIDAAGEANRARAEAKTDFAAVSQVAANRE